MWHDCEIWQHRPRIVKGWAVNKTQGRTIRNVIGGVRRWSTTVQLTTLNYWRTAKLYKRFCRKKEGIKRTIINICWSFSATPRFDSNVYFFKRTWAKKKTACFCGTYTVLPLQNKIHEPKTLNRKFKRQGVCFFLHKINQTVLPLWNVFKDIFSLDKFWSPMFKYLMGVFLHANNVYHTCPV